jgi:acyl carrier protein
MNGEWTREAVLHFIRKDLLLEGLDLAGDGTTMDDIGEDTRLLGEGLAIDSVDAMDLLVGVEKKFGLDLPDLDARLIESTCRSVGTLADFVMARLGAAQRL